MIWVEVDQWMDGAGLVRRTDRLPDIDMDTHMDVGVMDRMDDVMSGREKFSMSWSF